MEFVKGEITIASPFGYEAAEVVAEIAMAKICGLICSIKSANNPALMLVATDPYIRDY